MENLTKYLKSKLHEVQESKKNDDPKWVTKEELFKLIDTDVKLCLNNMFREKEIRVHKTVHPSTHDYVELVENDK